MQYTKHQAKINKEVNRLLIDIYDVDGQLVLAFEDTSFRDLAAIDLYQTEIRVNKSTINTNFKKIQKRIERLLSSKQFHKNLLIIEKKGLKGLSKTIAKQFKTIRRAGASIRGFLATFGEDHKAPPRFDKFIRKFGKLNDAIASKNDRKIKETAKVVVKNFERKKLIKIVRQVKPAHPKSSAEFLEKQLQKIAALLNHEHLPTEDFHLLRKRLKFVMNALQHIKAKKNQHFRIMRDYIKDLNDAFGEINDLVTLLDINKEIEMDHIMIHLPKQLRLSVANAISTVHVVVDKKD